MVPNRPGTIFNEPNLQDTFWLAEVHGLLLLLGMSGQQIGKFEPRIVTEFAPATLPMFGMV